MPKQFVLGKNGIRQQSHEARHPALSFGDVAQLVEHHICNVRVRGSNPLVSTRKCGMEATGLPCSGADIYIEATAAGVRIRYGPPLDFARGLRPIIAFRVSRMKLRGNNTLYVIKTYDNL